MVRGSVWTLVGYGAGQAIRLGSSLVLTRLLFPQAFGLMLLVNTVMRGLDMLSDLGIGPCVVQHRRGEETGFLNTAWTMQIVRGTALWGIAVLLCWPIAWWYEEPALRSLIPVVALSAVLAGVRSVSIHVMSRRLEVGLLTRLDLAGQAIAVSAMIGWALVDRSVWALAGGGLIGAAAHALLSHVALPRHAHRFAWERHAVAALSGFGRWILLSTALTFLAMEGDRLLLGRLVPLELLGVYGVAVSLLDAARALIHQLEGRVIFPAISRRTDLPRADLRQRILPHRARLLYVAAPAVAMFVGASDALVEVLYDARYHEAGWMLAILAVSLWPFLLGATLGGPALLAIGRPAYLALVNGFRAAFVLLVVPLAFHVGGLVAAIAAVSAIELPKYFVLLWGLRREGLSAALQDAATTGWFALWLGGVFLVRHWWTG